MLIRNQAIRWLVLATLLGHGSSASGQSRRATVQAPPSSPRAEGHRRSRVHHQPTRRQVLRQLSKQLWRATPLGRRTRLGLPSTDRAHAPWSRQAMLHAQLAPEHELSVSLGIEKVWSRLHRLGLVHRGELSYPVDIAARLLWGEHDLSHDADVRQAIAFELTRGAFDEAEVPWLGQVLLRRHAQAGSAESARQRAQRLAMLPREVRQEFDRGMAWLRKDRGSLGMHMTPAEQESNARFHEALRAADDAVLACAVLPSARRRARAERELREVHRAGTVLVRRIARRAPNLGEYAHPRVSEILRGLRAGYAAGR